MKRYKVNKKKSVRKFNKNVNKTHRRNLAPRMMRGGTRL
jgi:hypothetical protein